MENEFSFRTRKRDFEALENSECEVLIIGGGISGAGVANLLSENGVSTVLVEKGDFASGTSSGSSKLIHGGLRYLAQGEFREVKELLKERNYLLENTDFVKPMKFHIVVDQYSWKKSTLRAGLFIYNLLSGKFQIPHYMVNDGIYPKNVLGYFEYMDAFTDDSRLVVYNIVSAQRGGARCFNYVEAVKLTESEGKYVVALEDKKTGRQVHVNARIIVNAGGPWAAKIMEKFDGKLDKPLQLSKGVHIVVPADKIPVKQAIAFRSHLDRRQMFIIPRGKVVHIGTTDTFVKEPDDFSVNNEDVEYILKSVEALFPGLSKEDIVTAFAGIRPLFGSGDDPGKVSRDFEIVIDRNIVNLLGGKITNYRAASRIAVRHISQILGRKLNTSGLPTIPYRRAGAENEISEVILNECPLSLEDIMRRRMAYRIYEPDQGKSLEKGVAEVMEKLGMVVK